MDTPCAIQLTLLIRISMVDSDDIIAVGKSMGSHYGWFCMVIQCGQSVGHVSMLYVYYKHGYSIKQ